MGHDKTLIPVEVAYATPEKQVIKALEVQVGTCLSEAIEAAGIAVEFPGLEWGAKNVGVFSQAKPLDYILEAHDRVEIYRPLIIDPKEARRLKAEKQKAKAKKKPV